MEQKRSNCSSVFCCGLPVEKGCYIFSIINIVLCSAVSLGSVAFLIFILSTWFDGERRGPNDMVLVYLFTGMAAGCCVGSALALTFAILLVLGVRNGNKRYIMSYLIYGIVAVVASVLGSFGFIAIEWGEQKLMMYAMIPLGICVLYSLMLILVYQTYVLFSERQPATHKRLLNINES